MMSVRKVCLGPIQVTGWRASVKWKAPATLWTELEAAPNRPARDSVISTWAFSQHGCGDEGDTAAHHVQARKWATDRSNGKHGDRAGKQKTGGRDKRNTHRNQRTQIHEVPCLRRKQLHQRMILPRRRPQPLAFCFAHNRRPRPLLLFPPLVLRFQTTERN